MFVEYIKRNAIPVILEILFVVSCFFITEEYFIYTNCLFYVLLLIYFLIKKDIDLKGWRSSLKGGKSFWKQVMITILAFIVAFVFTLILEGMFPDISTGTINLRRDSWITLIVFTVSTILLPAVTEETFFRKNMIMMDNGSSVMIVTMIISMFLFSLEHAISWWGILLTMIWALPLSIMYVKTRNIYVVMTAHFIGNLLGNGIEVIFTAINLMR